MRSTPEMSTAAPRRKTSAPLPNDLRNMLRDAVTTRAPEAVALDAEVSIATVRRALAGHPVRPVVRAALARAVTRSPTSAAA